MNEKTLNLKDLRKQLDELDNKILDLLKQREEIVEGVKKYKQENNVAFFQPDREKQIFERIKEKAKKRGMNEKIAVKIFKTIITEFRNSEME